MLRLFLAAVSVLLVLQEPAKFPDAIGRDALARVKAATVLIVVKTSMGESNGTGFLVSAQGHIVTNRHVVESAGAITELSVVLNSGQEGQKTLKGTRILMQERLDLALIKIEGEGHPHLPLGNPKDLTETDSLWAFGFPLGNLFKVGDMGPQITVNKGSVTSLRKSKQGTLEGIQTDAQVNEGNSGGPLVSGTGVVYGVITFAIVDSSLRFAIPSDAVSRMLAPRVDSFSATPATLGVGGGKVTLTAKLQEILTPAESVDGIIEGGASPVEVKLDRSGTEWTGSWTAPALTEDELGRIEASLTLKDKSVKVRPIKGATFDIKTEFGNLRIPAADLTEIRFGDAGKPDRVDCRAGTIYGDATADSLSGDGVAAGDIVSARFEVKSGRTYKVRVRMKSAGVEIQGKPVTVAVGVPVPLPASSAPDFVAKLDADGVEKRLPGVLESAKLGGGGKYLVLFFRDLNTLGFFDLEQVDFAKHIQLQSSNALFAVGRRKLVVGYPETSRIERWNLETFEKELTVESPFPGSITHLEMGSNSEGPVIVRHLTGKDRNNAVMALLDLDKLKAVDLEPESQRAAHMSGNTLNLRVGASGSHFTWWRNGVSPSGVGFSRITEGKIEHRYAHDGAGFVTSSDDGTMVFTANGIYNADEVSISGAMNRRRDAEALPALPFQDGPFYVTIPGLNNSPQQQDTQLRGNLCLSSNRQKVLTIDLPLNERLGNQYGQWGELTLDRRLWFFARAKILVAIPLSNDRLICRKLDVDALLDRAGVDYLFVAGQPTSAASPGREWTYAMKVKSRKGGVKIKIESGPQGMTVDADHVFRWTPSEPGIVTVILKVSDSSGQEFYHSFKIGVK